VNGIGIARSSRNDPRDHNRRLNASPSIVSGATNNEPRGAAVISGHAIACSSTIHRPLAREPSRLDGIAQVDPVGLGIPPALALAPRCGRTLIVTDNEGSQSRQCRVFEPFRSATPVLCKTIIICPSFCSRVGAGLTTQRIVSYSVALASQRDASPRLRHHFRFQISPVPCPQVRHDRCQGTQHDSARTPCKPSQGSSACSASSAITPAACKLAACSSIASSMLVSPTDNRWTN